MRKISALFLVILFTLTVNAQSKRNFFRRCEVGGEGGLTIDHLVIRDPAGNMDRGGSVNGMGGAKFRTYLDRNLFIEAAFLWKENTFGFRFKQQRNYGNWSTNGSLIFMIPLRFGYEYKVTKKTSFTAIAGVVPSFITLHSGLTGFGTTYPENIFYSFHMKDEYKKIYVTLQPGISISHLIMNRIKFSYGINYYYGLSDAELYDVSYSINNGPMQSAVIANRGSFINYNGSLTYRFDLRKMK